MWKEGSLGGGQKKGSLRATSPALSAPSHGIFGNGGGGEGDVGSSLEEIYLILTEYPISYHSQLGVREENPIPRGLQSEHHLCQAFLSRWGTPTRRVRYLELADAATLFPGLEEQAVVFLAHRL